MNFNYYYNNVPGEGLSRNNLIYTSLISDDRKVFCQWYFNDSDYHKGQNQVVDPEKMEEKWQREIKFLLLMQDNYPDFIPEILEIDYKNKKVFLRIENLDFWNRAECSIENYCKVLPDWQDQMLAIIRAHRNLNLYKYSMHPSSYFVIDGKLKSINYFFTYDGQSDKLISIKDVESHIYSTRQHEMKKHLERLGISWDIPTPFEVLQELCWESFRTNYPANFIEKVKCIK
jgi:hypothetical protein